MSADPPRSMLRLRPLPRVPSSRYPPRPLSTGLSGVCAASTSVISPPSPRTAVSSVCCSARDLLRLRVDAAILLGDNIDAAADVAALARAWGKVPAMAAGLLGEEVGARDIAGIIAR